MKRFAVLQLSGCAGCEVSLLNAGAWIDHYQLEYMPLVISSDDVPDVDLLLVSGAVRTDEDLYRLRKAASQAEQVIAVGTCAISGGVANLGNRDEVRDTFFTENARRHVPQLLPHLRAVAEIVEVSWYLPGCPPTPELFMAALEGPETFHPAKTVCRDCGRKRTRERPNHLARHRGDPIDPSMCLINQGYICLGSCTRGGCGAPCTRAGHPCVGCRGPSDGFISRSSREWFDAINKVFARMTNIPPQTIEQELRSPQFALFVFQFADYAGTPRDVEKVI